MNDFCIALYTIILIISQYICYFFGRTSSDCIYNLLYKLSHINILYIKVLQALSTRDNLLSSEHIDYISQYTDNVPYTDDDIDSNFSLSLCQDNGNQHVVLENNGMPIKSGTVALVYKARLNNKTVIIKVARKNILERITHGLNQLRYIVRFILLFRCNLTVDVNQFLEEHRNLFLKQADFINEVNNIQEMSKNFKNIDNIIIPQVYPEFTNRHSNMIVMDYIEGYTLDKVLECDKTHYIEIIMKYFIKSFLYDKFYHGDFHPGNIIFIKSQPNNQTSNINNNLEYEYKVGIIDYGIVNRLTSEEQEGLHSFVEIICKTDDYASSLKLLTTNMIEPKNVYDTLSENQKNEIIQLISNIIKDSFSEGGMITPSDLNTINKLIFSYKLHINPVICQFILALSILDSVIHKLSENENYIQLLKIYANKMFQFDILEM